MKEITDVLSKIEDRLDSIDKTLVKQETNLEEHMRRTEIMEDKINPIEAHVHQMRGAGKLLGLLALVAGIIGTLILAIG